MTTQANGGATAPVVTAESAVVTSDPVVQSGASDAAAKPADAAKPSGAAKAAEGAAPIAAAPPAVDPEAAKKARKEARGEKVGEISALAKATRERFSETQAAKQAREAAEKETATAKATTQSAAELQAQLDAAKADVIGWALANGYTIDQLTERQLAKVKDLGLSDDQRKLEQAVAEARKLAEDANKRADEAVKKYEEGQKAAQQREAEAQAKANWDAARAAVVDAFEKGADSTYEHLDAYVDRLAKKTGGSKPAVLVNEFLMTVERLKRDPTFGPAMMSADPYSDEQILAYMNEFYEGIVPAKEKPAPAAAATADANGAPPAAKPALSAKPADTAPDNGKPAPATLTNGQASEVATSMPEGFDRLPEPVQNKLLAKMLKDGTLPGLATGANKST